MQKLHKYQKTGKTFLQNRRYALLADEQGLGKTVQALMAATELKLTKTLIICPASVKYVWSKEIDKWAPASQRIVDTGNDILHNLTYTIINYDLLRSKNIFRQLMSKHYDLIICDEAHYIKNLSAKRTKVVYYPKGLKDRTDRVWLLTGTPVLNRPVELFSHLKSLIPEVLGKYASYTAYTKHFCNAYDTKWGLNVSGSSNEAQLAKMLDGFMLRRMKKDVLKELPDKTYQTINFKPDRVMSKLSEKERSEYGKEKEGILGELATARRESGLAKIDLTVSHIQDLLETEEKIVIFAYHRDVIKKLSQALEQFNPAVLTGSTPTSQRGREVNKFRKDSTCRLFIGQIQAAGTGIDGLQDVCSTVVFAEMSWVPGQIHQAVDRCHRIGQKNPVLVQFLVVTGSIDEDIADSVAEKEKVIKKIIKPTETEQEEEVMKEKRFAVAVTVEVDTVTLADAVMAISEGMKSKDAEIKILHSAKEVFALAPSGAALTPAIQAVLDQQVPEMVKPEPKKKKAPAPKIANKPTTETVVEVDSSEGMDGVALMKYCNGEFTKINPATARVEKVKKVAAMFREEFGVSSVKEIPTDKIADAKAKFNEIMAGE